MDVTKPFKFNGFGDIDGPNPYEFIGSRATIISHTPVVQVIFRISPGSYGPDESLFWSWAQLGPMWRRGYFMLRNGASGSETELPSVISAGF